MKTAKIKVSAYVGYIASGSDIVRATADFGGYDKGLGQEMARVQGGGGTIELTAAGFRDLAEFADALSNAESQGGNTSGGRAFAKLAERCIIEAKGLEA